MTGKIYEFRKITKPLKGKRVNVYLREIDKENDQVYINPDHDKLLRSRCNFFKFQRDSMKVRMEFFFKEGTDLKLLEFLSRVDNNIVVTLETLNEKGVPQHYLHYLCVYDKCTTEIDFEQDILVEPILTLIAKSRLIDVDFINISDTNKQQKQEEEDEHS